MNIKFNNICTNSDSTPFALNISFCLLKHTQNQAEPFYLILMVSLEFCKASHKLLVI